MSRDESQVIEPSLRLTWKAVLRRHHDFPPVQAPAYSPIGSLLKHPEAL